MEKEAIFYRCQTCANLLTQLHEGGGRPVCCGNQMIRLEAKTSGIAHDTHSPRIERKDGRIYAHCGKIPHPSTETNHIEWVALVTKWRTTIRYLKPSDEPVAVFPDVKRGTVYIYCSLHGLWKQTF